MESTDSRAGQARLDRRLSAAGAPGLGRDPQVPGVAALELGDDLRPGEEPSVQDLHGRAAERARLIAELDARLAVEVQRADPEPGELGNTPPGIGDERGHRGGPQRRRGVGVNGPADGQVVQEPLGVIGGQEEAAGRRLAVQAAGQAEELGEGVVGIDAHAHRVGVRRGRGPVEAVAGTGLPGGGVGEPGPGSVGIHQLADRDISGAGRLLDVAQVLLEEVPADPDGGPRELAAVQMTEEGVDGIARRPWRLP